MTHEQFVEQMQSNFAKCIEIVQVKNKDYGGEFDPFKNFRSAQLVEVSPERAIMVRTLDKLARISNLLDRTNHVKDETVQDTLLDAMNYLNILKVYLDNK